MATALALKIVNEVNKTNFRKRKKCIEMYSYECGKSLNMWSPYLPSRKKLPLLLWLRCPRPPPALSAPPITPPSLRLMERNPPSTSCRDPDSWVLFCSPFSVWCYCAPLHFAFLSLTGRECMMAQVETMNHMCTVDSILCLLDLMSI